jgi:hypothetical protein
MLTHTQLDHGKLDQTKKEGGKKGELKNHTKTDNNARTSHHILAKSVIKHGLLRRLRRDPRFFLTPTLALWLYGTDVRTSYRVLLCMWAVACR